MTDFQAAAMVGTPLLLGAIQDRVFFWRTTNHEPMVDVVMDERRVSIAPDSQEFRGWLYEAVPGKIPDKKAVQEAVEWAIAKASRSTTILETNYRVAVGEDGCLYYDMGRVDRMLVRFGGGDWGYVESSVGAPRFINPPGAKAQVMALRTDKSLMDALRDVCPVQEEGDLSLICAWLLGCFKPGGPYPVLVINGEQGSAKSSTMRLLRMIIDPHSRDMVEPPNSGRDMVAVIKNGYVFALDNVSKMPPWLSDSLCRLSTGTGAIGGRRLYTTDDMAGFQAARPSMLNGIPNFIEREDLSDRSIHLQLPEIPDDKRQDDDSYWGKVRQAMPEILGALYGAVAKAQKEWYNIKLESAPRMSNFVRWTVAAMGEADSKLFLAAYAKKRRAVTEEFVEHSEVAQALIALLNRSSAGYWSGTLVKLLNELFPLAPNPGEFWPKNSWQLSARLARLKPELRKLGISIISNGREGGTGRTRIEIRKSPDFSERGYAVSSIG